jgi:hypothetical protein
MIDTQQQYINLNVKYGGNEREHIHINQVIRHQSATDTLS